MKSFRSYSGNEVQEEHRYFHDLLSRVRVAIDGTRCAREPGSIAKIAFAKDRSDLQINAKTAAHPRHSGPDVLTGGSAPVF